MSIPNPVKPPPDYSPLGTERKIQNYIPLGEVALSEAPAAPGKTDYSSTDRPVETASGFSFLASVAGEFGLGSFVPGGGGYKPTGRANQKVLGAPNALDSEHNGGADTGLTIHPSTIDKVPHALDHWAGQPEQDVPEPPLAKMSPVPFVADILTRALGALGIKTITPKGKANSPQPSKKQAPDEFLDAPIIDWFKKTGQQDPSYGCKTVNQMAAANMVPSPYIPEVALASPYASIGTANGGKTDVLQTTVRASVDGPPAFLGKGNVPTKKTLPQQSPFTPMPAYVVYE
jgi:hypothetical protein